MDVVYICAAEEPNEELRYSLRSLRNLPHRHVWVVGYRPRWVVQAGYVPTRQAGRKHSNTWRNWLAMADCGQISDRFVLFNDDFFVRSPITEVPTVHRGPLDDAITEYRRHRLTEYSQRAAFTRDALRRAGRIGVLYSYELHMPMVIDRHQLVEAVAWLQRNRTLPLEYISKRTFYGNWAQVGGSLVRDCKTQNAKAPVPNNPMFVSSSSRSWTGVTGHWARSSFPDPSPYEHSGKIYRPEGGR